MRKYIRIFIALMVVLSFVLLAKSQAAGAANPSAGQASLEQANSSSQLQSDNKDNDDCDDDKNDKTAKKDKKDKDDDDDCDNGGTVNPPDDDFDVCEKGEYSVGGVAVLDVKKLQDRSKKDDCFHAESKSSANVDLPKNAGPVLSDKIVLTSVGQGSLITICFAAPPGKKVKIYVNENNSWKAVGTQVKNGVACAKVHSSGSYVLGGK